MKRVSILGSTGSVGRSTLTVVDAFRDELKVVGLAAGGNIDLLAQQVIQYRPSLVSVRELRDVEPGPVALGRIGAARLASEARALAGREPRRRRHPQMIDR